jgi:hypothetical protein
MTKHWFEAALVAVISVCVATPVSAAVVLITQTKAVNGGIPGDAPGFPITLTQPWAYQLDTNLTVPAGKNGIHVLSHNVTIDMAGFSLFGNDVANYGVVSPFGLGRIHNGVINDFRIDGILLNGTGGNSNAWVVENMQIVENGDEGVDAAVSGYSRFLNNSILVNGGNGISCGAYCHVEGNTIADNGYVGAVLLGGTVLGNSIFSNDFFGIVDGTAGTTDVGYGNNTLSGNNSGGDQVDGGAPLQPNVCVPSC